MEHQVGYHKLINRCEWNNCFNKYQTLYKISQILFSIDLKKLSVSILGQTTGYRITVILYHDRDSQSDYQKLIIQCLVLI